MNFVDKFDGNKLDDNRLENIAGGAANLKKPGSDFQKLFPTKTIKCVGCGEEIEVTDYSKVAMGLIGSEYSRLLHYNKYCEKCKKDHLWPGGTYDKETGRIEKFKFKFNDMSGKNGI